ncbi:hypothetical protein KKF91_01895 [Myxococcota bacterium]|nr:hypothetical protein [Myxococcota bacterium]MBU1429289.1 hypothetical protein [Myxococcota bacterium]
MIASSLRLVGALALLLSPMFAFALSAEQIQRDFRDATNYYLYGDYPKVIAKLTPLVDPNPQLEPDKLAKAYELLGLAHFYRDELKPAEKHFKRLIWMDPEFRLNPVLVPVPAITFYDEIHKREIDEILKEREAAARKRKEEEDKRLAAMTREIYIETELNSRWVAAMPLGAGQFQNGRPYQGMFFLGGELLAAGLSAAFFLAVEDLRQDSGLFDRADMARAQDLQRAQLVSGGVALSLAVIGAGLALWRFEEIGAVHKRTQGGASPRAELLRWEF